MNRGEMSPSLVDTLVEVEMELEARRAAALAGAEAAALRALVVEVHAEGARVVQLMATWAHAPEAAVRVLARAWRGAQALRHQLIKGTVSRDGFGF
jgi:hypothetical protein